MAATIPGHTPSARRVAAGRLNAQKRRGLTAAGRAKLRAAALRHRPWRFATGPRTAAGKARVALNGKARQKGPRSVREARAELAELRGLLRQLQEARRAVDGVCPGTL